MDISALSEERFNAIDWINGKYRKYIDEIGNKNDAINLHSSASSDDSALLLFISNYVSKSQLYVQQVHYAVEETSHKLLAVMSRVIKDAHAFRAEVEVLKKRMYAMHKEMSDVQEETGDRMVALERLNTLQSKLQGAKESLQESDGWGNLIAELENCFEHNNLKGVFEKLVSLQKSMQVQELLHGHAERHDQVEDFKNRLEALASPSVVQCFAESNVEKAIQYVAIFSGIQRVSQLEQYYRAVQKNMLQQHWKQVLEIPVTGSGSKHFLSLFYDYLLKHCQQQMKWCAHVFDNTFGNLQPILVIVEILPSLQPTRDNHIMQQLKTCNERLELLEEYAQANHNFIFRLNKLLEQCNIKQPQDIRRQIGKSVYGYFYKFIKQYPSIEETQLSTQVDKLIISHISTIDSVRHLERCNEKMFDWMAEACQRCKNITNDLALCKLIAILGVILKRMLENFSKTQRQVALTVANVTENWLTIQCAVLLLECLAAFQTKLDKFEKSLYDRMFALRQNILSAQSQSECATVYNVCERQECELLLQSIESFQHKCEEIGGLFSPVTKLFSSTFDQLKSHFLNTHYIALNVLLQPIEAYLINIRSSLQITTDSLIEADLPAFSFAPQEYITQIGQYLLTLPQHLEPMLLTPSPLLKQALEICNVKYSQSVPCADILLSLVVEQCCQLYQSEILQIKCLSDRATKQLAVDVEYLSNVIEELGLSINVGLSQILTLLKAAPENYLTLSSGCEPRLVTAIRQMRNIISTQ